jgi:hypothetical protein
MWKVVMITEDRTHVTLHVWQVPGRSLPRVLWRMARDRGRLRRTPGVRFAKLLGTAHRFGRPDPARWAAVVSWTDPAAAERFDQQPVARDWRRLADQYCRLDLQPLSSKGTWAGHDPFPVQVHGSEEGTTLALTRARLRPTRAARFWRAIGPVAAGARQAPGLLAAFGIGEAPIGWQGTISLWRSRRDLVEFAYRHPAHRAVVAATPGRRWYAEELFARFAVLRFTGDRDVIGWNSDIRYEEREDGP